jgi:tetratricopeptide (TPR) repeat protein
MLPILLASALASPRTVQLGGQAFLHQELDNGLDAIAIEAEGDAYDIYVVYAVGSAMESAEVSGLAHLVEHTMYTGTATTQTGWHDARVLELGGESNAYTRADITTYYDTGIPDHALAEVLGMEADRMRGLVFDSAAFANERSRLQSEEQNTRDSRSFIESRRNRFMFGPKGYGAFERDEFGNSRAPSLGLPVVREFYDKWYQPERAAVVVVGPGADRIVQMIGTAFGGIPKGGNPPGLQAPSKGAPGSVEWELPLSRDREEWNWHGPPVSQLEDWVTLQLAAIVLSEGKASDGFPLEAVLHPYLQGSVFTLAATGDEARTELQEMMDSLRSGGFNSEEWSKAQMSLISHWNHLPLRGRPYFTYASELGIWASWDLLEPLSGYTGLVESISPLDVSDMAERYLDSERYEVRIPAEPIYNLPDDPFELADMAEAAQVSGDLVRAVRLYEKLLESQPDRVNMVIYRYYLGALYLELGDLRQARHHLELGLGVVEYPALLELLSEVVALERGSAVTRAVDELSTKKGATVSVKGKLPEWADEASGIMAELERWRGMYFSSDVDIVFAERSAGDAAGWYDSQTQQLLVTTNGSDSFGRGVMLHELFHALQDQNFGLHQLESFASDNDAGHSLSALVEGEAMWAVSQLMSYDFSTHSGLPVEGKVDDDLFEKIFFYGAGMSFVQALHSAGGWTAVEAAYLDPPQSTSMVYHPERYIAGNNAPTGLSSLPIGRKEQLLSAQVQGEYGLRLFLARSADTRPLMEELGGSYKGDSLLVLRSPKGSLHRWTVQFTNSAAAEVFADSVPSCMRAVGKEPGLVSLKRKRVTVEWSP